MEPLSLGEAEEPRPDHILEGSCRPFVPEFFRVENDSTETITVTFEGGGCAVDHIEGVTFGVAGGDIWVDDSLWVAYPDSTIPGSFYSNHPSPTSMARPQRSWTGDVFFDPPVSSVALYYCTDPDHDYHVYAYSATGSLIDSEPAPGNALNDGLNCSVWDSVRMQASSDRIVKVRISGYGNPVIDDLSFTRKIPPGIECLPSPVTRGEQVTCQVVDSVDAVTKWRFEGASEAGDFLEADSTTSVTTWSGVAVASGTVYAFVTDGGAADTLHGKLIVIDRTGLSWRWDSSKWDFQEGAGESCGYTAIRIPTIEVDFGQNTPIGRCTGGVIDPSPEIDPSAGYLDSMVFGGPNDGLWYVVEPRYEMNRGTSRNPYLEETSSQIDTLAFKQDVNACVDNDPEINKGDLVIVNWHRYNTVCRQESQNVADLFTAISYHEAYGTNPAPPEPNGHQSRYKLAAGKEENDPYKAVEPVVGMSQNELQGVIRTAIRDTGNLIFAFADDHSFVKDNGFGSGGNCNSVWLFNTDLNRFRSTEVELESGCI